MRYIYVLIVIKLFNFKTFQMLTSNHVTYTNHTKENNNVNNAKLLTEMQEAFRKLAEVKNFSRVAGKVRNFINTFIF